METISKPHISNLKSRLKNAFTHAYEHCSIYSNALDAGGDEGVYLLRSREFAAALGLLDRMVEDDRFLSPKSLQDCRSALIWYRRELQDQGYGFKSREIGDLASEIDAIAVEIS